MRGKEEGEESQGEKEREKEDPVLFCDPLQLRDEVLRSTANYQWQYSSARRGAVRRAVGKS